MINDALNLFHFQKIGDVRVWVNSDNLKKFKEQTLKDEEREAMITTSLEDAGWSCNNPIYNGIYQRLKDDFKFLQERNSKLPYVADFKNGGVTIRLGIYPKDSLDWIAERTEKMLDLENHDFALETTINQTVRNYEKNILNNEPGNILPIYKRGTILKEDGQHSLCQVDGLFQRRDGTWILCEAKSHLTLDQVQNAETTCRNFKNYLDLLKDTLVPEDYETLDNNSYWIQIKQFQKLIKDNNVEVVKYLGYGSTEKRIKGTEDPVTKALKFGFLIVEPTNEGHTVKVSVD